MDGREKISFPLPVKLKRSKRKSISIEVGMEGILIRAPYLVSDEEIYDFMYEKRAWLTKHCQKIVEQKGKIKCVSMYTTEGIQQLAEKACEVIPKKVAYYANKIGVDYGRITIRNQRTRWGSCSSLGNLNFNCLLMLFPDDVIDSVVVHELCHRKYMNHSSQFYEEVEKAFPKYKECQRWLKENGSLYLARLP